MKKRSLIVKLTIAMLLVSAAGAAAQDLYFGGYVRNNTGVLLNDDIDFSQVQNTFDLKAEYYGDISELKAEVFINQADTEEIEVGVKELYMDIFFDSMDLRIGKQQIIWGKADGVFITDIISPKDLTNFVLPDFDEVRMGVTALKAEYYMDAVDFEFVWIPRFTPAVMPLDNTLWEVDTPLTVSAINLPETTLDNSEVYGKISYMGSAIDVELMGGYMWDDLPAAYYDPAVTSIVADYNRVALAGGSFSTDIAGLIVRGEGAYYNGKNFTVKPEFAPASTVEKDFVNYMVGLDYSIAGITLGTQFIQEIVLDYDENIVLNDEFKNTMTFVMAKSFMNETLMVEFFSYVGLTNEDALLRPKVTYDLADGLEWIVGADIFLGDSGDFGQYDDNDIVYTKVKYSF
ncbi:MAG: hypothetical protein KAR21_13570 [Spirochaetales bacterium]|nr:hypothetical protein [Spirochaetales bacterium]